MNVLSLAEVLSIAAVLPFIGFLVDPQLAFDNKFLKPLYSYFGFSEAGQVILPTTIFFCVAILIAGALRVLLLILQNKISMALGSDLCVKLFSH